MKRHQSILCFILVILSIFNAPFSICFAQTAKVYRGGTLLSTHSTLAAACAAANTIGDSILLSAHTFYEHDIPAQGGQTWQGTYTPTDSTIIDAQSLGRVFSVSTVRKFDTILIRNIICQNGKTTFPELDGGGINNHVDRVVLDGYSIVRNCYALRRGGGVTSVIAKNRVKITGNTADSIGGGAYSITLLDSVEISHNKARYGGGVQYPFILSKRGVKICHNTATIGGGGIYEISYSDGGAFEITNNQAPLGAALYGGAFPSLSASIILKNAYIYNPAPDGSRQNEIFIDGGTCYLEGTWFGKSDTLGLITQGSTNPTAREGKYATTSWSVNRGAALTAKDTLFPIGAAFVYNDGTPMPPNACPWLVGKFSASTGTMLSPNPTVNALDTMSSMFRTYAYPVGGSGSKPIDFLCIVDGDTFRTTKLVWGRSALGIEETLEEQNVLVYPNPAKDYININGAAPGSDISLYDVSGKLMKNEKVRMNNTVLELKGLPAGNYILKITTKDGQEGSATIMVNE